MVNTEPPPGMSWRRFARCRYSRRPAALGFGSGAGWRRASFPAIVSCRACNQSIAARQPVRADRRTLERRWQRTVREGSMTFVPDDAHTRQRVGCLQVGL